MALPTLLSCLRVYEEVQPLHNILVLTEYPRALRCAKLCFPPEEAQNSASCHSSEHESWAASVGIHTPLCVEMHELHPCRLRTEMMTHTQYYYHLLGEPSNYNAKWRLLLYHFRQTVHLLREVLSMKRRAKNSSSPSDRHKQGWSYSRAGALLPAPEILCLGQGGCSASRAGHITEQAAQVFSESCAFKVVLLSCLQDECSWLKLSFLSPLCTGMEAGNICSQTRYSSWRYLIYWCKW